MLAYYAAFGRGYSLLGVGALFMLVAAAIALIKAALWLLIVVVLVQAILSWVAPDGPLAGLLNALTFPFLRPVRRLIPPIGGTLDLSPVDRDRRGAARADLAGDVARVRRHEAHHLTMVPIWLRDEGDALVLSLHVQPGAKRTEIAGAHGGALRAEAGRATDRRRGERSAVALARRGVRRAATECHPAPRARRRGPRSCESSRRRGGQIANGHRGQIDVRYGCASDWRAVRTEPRRASRRALAGRCRRRALPIQRKSSQRIAQRLAALTEAAVTIRAKHASSAMRWPVVTQWHAGARTPNRLGRRAKCTGRDTNSRVDAKLRLQHHAEPAVVAASPARPPFAPRLRVAASREYRRVALRSRRDETGVAS